MIKILLVVLVLSSCTKNKPTHIKQESDQQKTDVTHIYGRFTHREIPKNMQKLNSIASSTEMVEEVVNIANSISYQNVEVSSIQISNDGVWLIEASPNFFKAMHLLMLKDRIDEGWSMRMVGADKIILEKSKGKR